ncbi:hypothetical protein B0H15DRAFT_588116 [Mycena belliarum]|uniref:Uncharacterized protein n=1 Tax=Mycena belliarum TaxID=1033014 RepID=A0AAD6UDD2_9AGAR|nr:hypothetical protein B0H15DRAFT_588116 [Mycena belliae]
MIVQGRDGKSALEASVEPAEPQAKPTREPSPPPAYSASTSAFPITSAAAPIPEIVVQHPSPELPNAFRPPSPSSFPHLNTYTGPASPGPTPFFLPAATPAADGHYAYYDPRSPYSIARADRRALSRFWGAFGCAVGILVLLWLLGLLQFGG